MPMKKAEMEGHHEEYHRLLKAARSAERDGLYEATLERSVEACDHLDGMLQYERKYGQGDLDTVAAIDLALRYAPLVFDYEKLDKLEELLSSFKRVERNTSTSMKEKLRDARSALYENHRLWHHIEESEEPRQSQLRQALGGDQDYWRSVAEAWEKMGLLERTSEGGTYRLRLVTRLHEVVSAKCPACGEVAEGPKAMFFEESECPTCEHSVLYVLLSRPTAAHAEE